MIIKTITTLNVNSIRSRSRCILLNNFIIEHNPDILLLSETHLKPTMRTSFKGYTMLKGDRLSGNGGGPAILFKQCIPFKNQETLQT